jgi:hypothetical protein
MAKQRRYDDLPLMPDVMAETVVSQPYTGEEWSNAARSHYEVERIERLRRALTEDQRRDFVAWVDARCRYAYEAQAEWFLKCVRSKTNRGRDQMLHVWVPHWLAAFCVRLERGEVIRRPFPTLESLQ